ncbi:MAG: hypothetical protein H5U04_05090 [Firmicutes bacterium]|nr:hypothetical protein [Bacillota bacterium]
MAPLVSKLYVGRDQVRCRGRGRPRLGDSCAVIPGVADLNFPSRERFFAFLDSPAFRLPASQDLGLRLECLLLQFQFLLLLFQFGNAGGKGRVLYVTFHIVTQLVVQRTLRGSKEVSGPTFYSLLERGRGQPADPLGDFGQ